MEESYAPYFIQTFEPSKAFNEGDTAKFECRIKPENDQKMAVEIFHNNQPLASGHRYKIVNNFGFISLHISDLKVEDSGLYTCLCRNESGSCQTTCQIFVNQQRNIILESQHPSSLPIIHQLETPKTPCIPATEPVFDKPKFLYPFKSLQRVEGQGVHFETRLLPVDDPEMKIEWFFNGQPLFLANRLKTLSDFGYVSLDISDSNTADSGTYCVKAWNKQGMAMLTANLTVSGNLNL